MFEEVRFGVYRTLLFVVAAIRRPNSTTPVGHHDNLLA